MSTLVNGNLRVLNFLGYEVIEVKINPAVLTRITTILA